jgi:ABC-2 type transport system permease protein
MTSALREVRFVAGRSVRRTLRQPANVVPSIVFPLVLLAVNASGLDAAALIPGFPADDYLQFAIVIPFMQAALFSAVAAGTELAGDVETGFLDRLALTPLRRVAILLGQLAGALALAALGAAAYLTVGLIAGVSFEAGLAGVVVLVVLALLVALGFGTIGQVMALRTGSGEAVQGLFPLLFVTLFLSSMALPRPLIEIDWFRTVATWNPASYLIEGMRSLVITGWDATALARGFGVAAALLLVGFALASAAMRTRMERT